LTPKQFFNEYTYNEILEDLYAHNKKIESEEWGMKRQAWYTWLCTTNRPIFGQEKFEFHPFDELFPEPKEELPSDPELTKQICKAHNINLLDVQAKCTKLGIKPPSR